MKKQLTSAEIEKRFEEINAKKPEAATEDEVAAISAVANEDPEDTVTLEEYKTQKEYSGKLMLRIPRELHRDLALAAKANGVSLNQYAAYKLAR